MQPLTRRMVPVYVVVIPIMVIALFYVLPTLLEWKLLPNIGGFATIVLIGDFFPCAAIALVNWKKAVVLYVALSGIEIAALHFGLVTSRQLIFFTDLIPTAIIAVFATTLASMLFEIADDDPTRRLERDR
jgi:hypothetical protein